MRFSVQKKIVLLGTGLSFLLMVAAFLTSFIIYKNRSEKAYINNVDLSIEELKNSIGDDETIDNMRNLVRGVYYIYFEHLNDDVDFQTPEDKYEYYRDLYSVIYPSNGFGMTQEKLAFQTTYLDVASSLSNASISAGTNVAYAGILIDSSITGDNGRLFYLFDSKFRFGKNEGNFFGSDYKFQADDKDVNPDTSGGDYVLNGKNTRTLDINLGKLSEITNGHLDGYPSELADKDVIITAFIEYDLSILNSEFVFFSIVEGLSLLAVLIILTISYILIARFVIVKNIVELTDSTKEFTNKIMTDEIKDVINPNIKSNDEIGILSKSFVKMEEEIFNYTEKIKLATTEREKINAELNVANTIQLEALPKKSLNDHKVLIEASIKSAKEVGGDFYDYFYLDDNHLAIIVSDVSGKGVPAALFMMKSKELIKSKLLMNRNIEDVCFEVNNELLENNEAGLFITAFIGILDLENLELVLVNCGHEKPYVISKDKVVRVDVESNFILGGIEDYKYKKDIIKLDKEDRIFIHTDGLNESINEEKEEFGYDRIIELLKNNSKKRLKDILIEADNSLNSFTKNEEAFDDVTMVLVELKSPELKFKYVNPDYSMIDEVTNKFEDYYSYIDKDILYKINIIIDEILNNYVSYESNGNLVIEVYIKYINNELMIKFINNGVEFNPLNKDINYIEEDSDDLKTGGLGLTIIKNFSSNIDYERKDDKNYLTIKMKI